MRNYSYELGKIKGAMEKETNALWHHIEAFRKLFEKDVLKQFDGKVVNVRLQRAIKEQTGFSIYLNDGLLTSHAKAFADYNRTQTFELVIEDKRLNADETNTNLKYFVSNLLTELEKYKYDEQSILAYFNEMEDMNTRIQELRKTMPYIVRDNTRNTFYNIQN